MNVSFLRPVVRIGALWIAAAATTVVAQEPPVAIAPAGRKAGVAKIVVSRETTYFTEPLDADGNVDYLAALNRRFSAGVTPENNAAVPYWRACGRPRIDPAARDEYFRLLGSPVPPEDGKAYRYIYDVLDSRPEWSELYLQSDFESEFRAWKTPWTGKEYPWLVPWVDENQAALAALAEASRRPKFFDPAVNIDPYLGVGGTWEGAPFELYGIGKLLVTRAMYRAGSGNLGAACDDLGVAYRMAALCGRKWDTRTVEQAASFQCGVGEATLSLLELPGLTRKHVKRLRSERQAAPAMTPLVESIDVGDRISSLNWALVLRRRGIRPYIEMAQPVRFIDMNSKDAETPEQREAVRKTWPETPVDRWLKESVDWNPVLKGINARYDELISLLGKPYPERREKVAQLLKQFETSPPGLSLKPDDMRVPSPEQSVDAALHLVLEHDYRGLLLRIHLLVGWEVTRRLHELALDLAEFRLLHGKYPEQLAELATIEGAGSRIDPFTTREFIYRKTEKGYLLYSPGENLRDDDGKDSRDARKFAEANQADKSKPAAKEAQPDWDDIRVRMPHQPE
jgi:hypothetical protein